MLKRHVINCVHRMRVFSLRPTSFSQSGLCRAPVRGELPKRPSKKGKTKSPEPDSQSQVRSLIFRAFPPPEADLYFPAIPRPRRRQTPRAPRVGNRRSRNARCLRFGEPQYEGSGVTRPAVRQPVARHRGFVPASPRPLILLSCSSGPTVT